MKMFFQSFELLTDAPNAIAKFREITLQLAVKGKLVPQNSNDEPASILMARIRDEIIKSAGGLSKKLELLEPISKEDIPFNLPKGWMWVRFPELGQFGRGKSKHRPRNDPKLYEDGKYPLVQTGDVARSKGIIKTYTGLYNDIGLAQSRLWSKGTLCITIAANIADSGILDFDACIPDSIVGFVPSKEIGETRYFDYFVRTAKDNLQDYAPSTAQKNINLAILEKLLIPLPPLAEQKRIVEKCDRLLSICDEIEKRQQQRQESIVRMNESAIAQLLSFQNPDEFRQHWQRICNNFDLLYSIPETIPKLRLAILQLAVEGKLVRQHISDGCGSVLLKEIAIDKEPLIKEGKIKKALLSPQEKNDIYFEIPDNWIWARFGDVILDIEAGASPLCDKRPKNDDEWGVIKISAVSWDKYNPNENKALPIGVEPKMEYEIKAGDFLMSRANTNLLVGKSVIVEDTPPRLLINDKTLRVYFPNLVYKRFFNLYNNSIVARKYYAAQGTGTSNSMKNITREQIRNLPVPLPPLAEQKRIVEKCDRLMSLCDTLEAKLKQGRDSSEKLMEVAAKQVLTA